ncbi:GGDEF domain-containing protein [Thalassotalea ganghwensis]
MDPKLISGFAYLFVATMTGVIATLYFSFSPLKFDYNQRTTIRYFSLLFLSYSCFYVVYATRPFIDADLSVLLANFFFTLAMHCLRYGLMWRVGRTHKHIYQDMAFWVNLGVIIVINYILLFKLSDSLSSRQMVSSWNLFLVYIAASRFIVDKIDNPSKGEKIFRTTVWVLMPFPLIVLIPSVFYHDPFINASLVLVWLTLQTIALFGGLTFLLLSDVIDMHYRNSVTDPLTKLFNRRHFMAQASAMISSAHRHAFPMSVILCDIDHFKQVNDSYGHNIGDKVIVKFANILKNQAREEDVVARFGGEEFIILLPQTNADGAKALATRMCEATRKLVINCPQGEFQFTASFGVATFDSTINIEENIKNADEALYLAKESGRNQVVVYSSLSFAR